MSLFLDDHQVRKGTVYNKETSSLFDEVPS